MASRASELFLAFSFLLGQTSVLFGAAYCKRTQATKAHNFFISSALIYVSGAIGKVIDELSFFAFVTRNSDKNLNTVSLDT